MPQKPVTLMDLFSDAKPGVATVPGYAPNHGKWEPPRMVVPGSGGARDPEYMEAHTSNAQVAAWIDDIEAIEAQALESRTPTPYTEFDRKLVRSCRLRLLNLGEKLADENVPCVLSGRQLVFLHVIYSKVAEATRKKLRDAR